MIIGVDARPLSYYVAGIGQYLLNILDVLQQIDHQNTYYLVSNKKIDYPLSNPLWRKVEGRMGKRLTSSLWMQCVAPGLAARYGFDLIWGPRHHLPLLLPRRVKRVLTIHDLVHIRYPETMKTANLILERILMKKSLQSADAIIAVSKATASDIIGHYGGINLSDHLYTLYSGVPKWPKHDADPDFLRNLPDKFFLCVGTLEPRKNLINVLLAFEQIAGEDDTCHLVMAGETGWKTDRIDKWLASNTARSRIIQTGYIDRADLKGLYERALCLVFPSLYEGFGFPILEAMSLSVPVITSNVSSMKEIAGEAAVLVNPHKVEDIAAAMRRIVDSPDLSGCLNRKAEARLSLFSWQQCGESLLNLFHKVAKH